MSFKGDIVQIGPFRLSLNTVEALKAIYGPRASKHNGKFLKTGFYNAIPGTRTIFTEVDPEVHTGIRKLVNPSFTPKSVGQYEAIISANARKLLDKCLEDSISSGSISLDKPNQSSIALNKYIDRYIIDVMGSAVLGTSFNCLERGASSLLHRGGLEMN
jgi:cytochrome P450